MRHPILTGFLSALLGLVAHTATADNDSLPALTVQEAATWQTDKQAVILDVRENSEWQAQHIPNAVHIPLGELSQRLPELDRYKNSTIITQCRSGKRSAQAQIALKAAGFNHVYNLTGGISAWQAQGLKVE